MFSHLNIWSCLHFARSFATASSFSIENYNCMLLSPHSCLSYFVVFQFIFIKRIILIRLLTLYQHIVVCMCRLDKPLVAEHKAHVSVLPVKLRNVSTRSLILRKRWGTFVNFKQQTSVRKKTSECSLDDLHCIYLFKNNPTQPKRHVFAMAIVQCFDNVNPIN